MGRRVPPGIGEECSSDPVNTQPRTSDLPCRMLPTRPEIAPYINGDAIECWIGGDTSEHRNFQDAAHSDFWRVSPEGRAFLIRGYQEDGEHALRQGVQPARRKCQECVGPRE